VKRSTASEMDVTPEPMAAPQRQALPTVSVVVASNRPSALLAACLEPLIGQCRRAGAELIVARAADSENVDATLRAFPGARLVVAPAGSSVPQLRAAGMSSAHGDIVALTEDACIADPHWVATLVRGAANGADVVGGGIDNGKRARVLDLAAYFAEYGVYSTTRSETAIPTQLIAAANVAYSRTVVEQVIEWASRGEQEYVTHNRLEASGRVFRFVRTAAVYQNSTTAFWPFCLDRYEHGRHYARTRLVEERDVNRWLRLLSCPLLPILLTARIARAAGASRIGAFIRALPATFMFMTAWSCGEAAGYLRGPAIPSANTRDGAHAG
jgi:hypothetical protein